jgi:hypothetical protein
MASSVPFDPDDDVGGAPESSGLPYSTLLRLPPHGIVITATFTPRGAEPWRDAVFPPRKLPLRLPAVAGEGRFGAQLRLEEPLGVYGLNAAVNGHNIDLHIYFGTPQPSPEMIERAQRQLDLLVVRPVRPSSRLQEPHAGARGSAPEAVIDRTYLCATRSSGGLLEIEARAHAGVGRGRPSWDEVPLAGITTGSNTGGAATSLDNDLAWMTAGRPGATARIIDDPFAGFTYPVRVWGTLAVNRKLCRSSSALVPLTRDGLSGGLASPLGDTLDCATPRRVFVRLQAIASSSALKQHRQFLRTTEPVREARLAVRTESGKRLVYAEVFQSGKARLFTARGCAPD